MVEPALSAPYSVSLSLAAPGHESAVTVALAQGPTPTFFSAPMDRATGRRLSEFCRVAKDRIANECATLGRDGTWYRAFRNTPGGRRQQLSFWSPLEGTFARALVDLVEALRDYASAPRELRAEQWRRIQRSEASLESAIRGAPDD